MNNFKNIKKIDRRTAIKITGASIASTALISSSAQAILPTTSSSISGNTGPGHVVKVHMPGMRVGAFPHPDAAQTMVERAIVELSGTDNIEKAWLKFIKPTDKIGLKVNCLGTKMVSSMREVVYAVANSLNKAGVPNENITIIDMYASNMMGGRYDQQPNPKKIRVIAHREYSYLNKTFKAGPAIARFSNLFMECDSIINIPPIKDHDLVGVTCCMKNVTFGVVEKPHINHKVGNEAIAHLWALDEIRNRVKLNLIDGSTILYDGGPKYNRKALVPHESIYATTDPVAMDSIAHELIEHLRAENGLRTLAAVRRSAHFINQSEKMGLGIADMAKINLQTINLPRFSGDSA